MLTQGVLYICLVIFVCIRVGVFAGFSYFLALVIGIIFGFAFTLLLAREFTKERLKEEEIADENRRRKEARGWGVLWCVRILTRTE